MKIILVMVSLLVGMYLGVYSVKYSCNEFKNAKILGEMYICKPWSE